MKSKEKWNRMRLFLKEQIILSIKSTRHCGGSLVAQEVKHWTTGWANLRSIRPEIEIFSVVSGFHCTQPCIITCPWFWYDWKTVEEDVTVKSSNIHSSLSMQELPHPRQQAGRLKVVFLCKNGRNSEPSPTHPHFARASPSKTTSR